MAECLCAMKNSLIGFHLPVIMEWIVNKKNVEHQQPYPLTPFWNMDLWEAQVVNILEAHVDQVRLKENQFSNKLLMECCSHIPFIPDTLESPGSPLWLVAQLNASCCPLPGSLSLPCLIISAAWVAKITISSAGNPASREEGEASGSQIGGWFRICCGWYSSTQRNIKAAVNGSWPGSF